VSNSVVVALLVETSRAYGRGICQGIARYAQENPAWSIIYQERSLKQSVPKIIRHRHVDGILMRVDQPRLAAEIISLGIPLVDLLHLSPGWPSYQIDDRSTAQMAANYFMENGFIHFAFCGYSGIPFSDRRETAYTEFLRQRNFPVFVYRPRPTVKHQNQVLRAEELGFNETEALAAWLCGLPRTTGLFACNDVRALQVLQACQLGSVSVPDQVAVLGVDNDEIITELSHPKLSSIQPDTVGTGYKACQCLDAMIQGKSVLPVIDYTPPVGVIERDSSNFIATQDHMVAAALRIIRSRACSGLTIKELLGELAISRSNLESRFRRVLGRTVHDEITRVRIQRVRQLLHSTDKTLAKIAAETGYLDISHLSRSFRKKTGKWPGQYRRDLG
jgi:LacI family transcriptional regulator